MPVEEILRIVGIELVVTILTIVTGVVTIVWFIRDVRKENSKILKAILDVQNSSVEIQKSQAEILAKIEEGQRRGFQALEEGQRKGFETLEKGLEALEEGQRKLADILNNVSSMLLNQTKILERINGKL